MKGCAVSPLFFGFALVGCVEEEPKLSFLLGMQSDCSVQDIDFAFDAPVDEGNGIVSWVDAGGGLGDYGMAPEYSDLMIASCSSQTWIGAAWDNDESAQSVLAQLRASDEQISEMLDDVQKAGATTVGSGSELQRSALTDGLGGMSSIRCGCDIYYKTDFGQYGASHE